MAVPTLLYGFETRINIRVYYMSLTILFKKDICHIHSADMNFLKYVKGYTRNGRIRTEVIRHEFGISSVNTKNQGV